MADLEKVLGKTGAEKFWNKVWGNVKILTGDVAYKTKGDLQTQVTAAAMAAATAKSTADAAKTAASTAQNQAGNFGTAFSTTKAYAVGDYVIYGNKLYKFTTAHPAGDWNASHVTETTVAAELATQNKNFAELSENLLGYPDYENVTLLATNKKASGIIAESGYLFVNESGAGSEMAIQINSKVTVNVRLANSKLIPVFTGDTWEIINFTANAYLSFIPLRRLQN